MPIFLLPEMTVALTKLGQQLSTWGRLTDMEEQILRRARGAFLVHWFGHGVPERQLNLLIMIVNIEQLRARYALAKRSMPSRLPRMSLLSPLAGIVGYAAGLFFSLSGVFLFAPHIHSMFEMLTDSWWREPAALFYSLVGNWVMPLLAPMLGVFVVVPFLIGWMLSAALGGDRESRAVVQLLGDAAMMLDAFLGFWAILTGPPKQIRNPVVRGVIMLLDRIAALFAQMLGFVALVVTRLLPIIPHLLGEYRAGAGLAEAFVATLRDITTGFVDALKAPFLAHGGILAVLHTVLDAFLALPAQLIARVREAIADTLVEFQAAFATFNTRLDGYIGGLRARIVDPFQRTPLGQLIDRIHVLLALVPQLSAAFTAIPANDLDGPPTNWDAREESMRGTLAEIFSGGVFGPGLGTRAADLIHSVRTLTLPGLPALDVPGMPAAPTLPASMPASERLSFSTGFFFEPMIALRAG